MPCIGYPCGSCDGAIGTPWPGIVVGITFESGIPIPSPSIVGAFAGRPFIICAFIWGMWPCGASDGIVAAADGIGAGYVIACIGAADGLRERNGGDGGG